MSEWVVRDIMSRVAEHVTSAGTGLVALVERTSDELVSLGDRLCLAFPRVEPSPDFVERLYHELLTAPIAVLAEPAVVAQPDRRIVFGVAAIGSLASAAFLAALILRNRGHRLVA